MNALEIHGLSKSYGGFALQGLDLTLPSGCIMGLVGENGAGKTTTIKLILGMLKADSGSISILGSDGCTQLAKEDIGVVLDEVGLPACLTAAQVDKIMQNIYSRWNSAQFFAYLEQLSVPANKMFSKLSRGMKMKLGLACALSHAPKLLILDEATSGLDPVVRDEVIDILGDFTRSEEHSILMSSHIVTDLEKLCDYIAFIHKGRLMLCEEKDRLYEQYGILRCDEETLSAIEPAAIIGKRSGAFGSEVIVRRSAVPEGMQLGHVGIEELFVFMVKEAV